MPSPGPVVLPSKLDGSLRGVESERDMPSSLGLCVASKWLWMWSTVHRTREEAQHAVESFLPERGKGSQES